MIFSLTLKIMKKKIIKSKNLNIEKYFTILVILFICIVIWFLKAPIFRYGYSYIVSFSFNFCVNYCV